MSEGYCVLVNIDGEVWSLDALTYADAESAHAVAAEALAQGLDAFVDGPTPEAADVARHPSGATS